MSKHDGMTEMELKFWAIIYYLRKPGIEFENKRYKIQFDKIKEMLDAYNIIGWDRNRKVIIRETS